MRAFPAAPPSSTSRASRTSSTPDDDHLRQSTRDEEEFTLADFVVGREVGIGTVGEGGHSAIGAGLRYADLQSVSEVILDGIPDHYIAAYALNTSLLTHHTRNTSMLNSVRGFEGVGPTLRWEASTRLWGDDQNGHADLEWSAGGGVLFGKQTHDSTEDKRIVYYSGFERTPPLDATVPRSRTEDVTVPNLSLSLGLSYSIDRVKVSTGYAYDRFFDAIDGGYDESQTFDRTIHGPYLRLSIGFGG